VISKHQWFFINSRVVSALIISVLTCAWVVPAMSQSQTAAASSSATTTTGTIRGQVTDPSGAVVANATIGILVSGTTTHVTASDHNGNYQIENLAPGSYTVVANAKGFAIFAHSDVAVSLGQATEYNIALDISVEEEKVNVEDLGPQLDVNPANNASAIVLSGKDLEALPDDPDELQSDLEALAGPSGGPNGGQIYIDGFTGGQLPPKSSIREIRINQNPFSAEFDKLGYGRVEIFTKPGTDKYHGQFSVEGNSSGLNTRNPFLGDAAQTPYDSVIYMGNFGGPINKKASFFFTLQRRDIDEIAVVNASVLGADSLPTPFNQSVPNPRTRTNLGPRIDYQLTPSNTLTARYQYYRDTQQNAGVGGLVLPDAGYDAASAEHTLQISDSQILGSKAVNETRFQYLRDNSSQNPLSFTPSLDVLGSFIQGGSTQGRQADHQDHYELQNYTSIAQGKHFLKFGGRLRVLRETNVSSEGFNGSYTFASLAAFAGNFPNQYSISATPSGVVPNVAISLVDVGLYVQDDWKLRRNLTLSGGLRFESQNAISNHSDWAPRLGFAWGIGGGGKTAPKTVLRGGFGIFYERFTYDLLLNATRFNGEVQQQYVLENPPYPTPPPVSTLPPTTQSIYQISSQLHAPYILQTAFSLERQFTKIANATVSYLNARGVHQFLTDNVNAPLPGSPYSTGPKPNSSFGPIDQYISDGQFRQNQLITNFNIRASTKISLFGYYVLNYANSNAAGPSSFPSNPYNLAADYGRASFDIRHRVVMGGSVGLPHAIRLSPFLIFNSGTPYNVTTGQDLNNDLVFNDRPALGTNLSGACVSPTVACHYVVPTQPYTPIPINTLTGPNHFTLNLRLAKTFGFGPDAKGKNSAQSDGGPPGGGGPQGGGGGGGGGGGAGGGARGGGGGGFGRGPGGGGFGGGAPATTRRYNLTLSVNVRNVFNIVNGATPVGVLTSPNFGRSIALATGPFSSAAANRKIELQATFTF
jgi:Carboxypeptidase regulatory-like domain